MGHMVISYLYIYIFIYTQSHILSTSGGLFRASGLRLIGHYSGFRVLGVGLRVPRFGDVHLGFFGL